MPLPQIRSAKQMLEEGHLGGAWILVGGLLAVNPKYDEAQKLMAEIMAKKDAGAAWDPADLSHTELLIACSPEKQQPTQLP